MVERLEKTLAELRTLQSSVKGDIQKAEEVLAEKKRCCRHSERKHARESARELRREILFLRLVED